MSPGLKEAASLSIDGSETLSFEPSIGVPAIRGGGIHVRLASAAKLFATPGAAPGRAHRAASTPSTSSFS